ncbi:hypothetical protein L3X38_007467 [Prunus dulcis]|uniref:Oleosin n=1 Tax=Prunus dulcis TaxID=3755 RepID=A0AAD5F606_PRUDU|nr:hypothetical protein L3X38_007467 [Prunus dulcis]
MMESKGFPLKQGIEDHHFPSTANQSKEITQNLYGRSAPPSHQTVKLLTAAIVGATLLFLSGLTLTGTVIALIMATPVLVLSSPILVPAGIVMLLIAAGFVFSGGCGMAAMTVMAWLYNYVSNYAAAKQRATAYGQFVMLDI